MIKPAVALSILMLVLASPSWGQSTKADGSGLRRAHHDYVGKTINSEDGDVLGKVVDLMVNFRDKSIEYVVVSLNSDNERSDLYAVLPWGVVEGGGLSENLSCTVTPEQLAKATTFPKNRWPAMTDSAWCADVYGAFHKKPYRPSSSKERLGEPSLARLSKVIDMGVRNREDEYLGDIKELVVQGNDGQIAYVVLSFGGSLLSDSKYFAIPTASLGFGANGEKPLLATNRQALKDTDGFDKDNWPSSASDELLAKGIAHTAKVAERERLAADIDAKNAMALSPPCMKSSEFLGRRVVNRKGEKIGRLDELMIDLPAGRVAFAVVSVAGSGGAAGRLCAVPAEAFEVSKVDDSVSLDIDAVRMAKAPVFTHSEDPIPCDRRWLGSVYKYYGIVPYWTLPDLSTIR